MTDEALSNDKEFLPVVYCEYLRKLTFPLLFVLLFLLQAI